MIIILQIFVITAYWLIGAEHFPDYAQYIPFVENIPNDWNFGDLFQLESLSRLVFSVGLHLFGTPHNSILFFATLNQLFILLCLVYIYVKYKSYRFRAIILVSIFSPLLSFVILRAAPAYLIVAIAIFIFNKSKIASIILFLLALGFHSSVILLLPALILSILIYSPLRKFNTFILSMMRLIGLFLGGFFLFNLSDFIANIITSTQFLQDDFLGVRFLYISSQRIGNGLFHTLWFFVVTFLVFYYANRRVFSLKLQFLYTLAYFTYCLALFSPVVAFRFSIFFIIPYVLHTPLEKTLYLKKMLNFGAFHLFSLSAFLFSIYSLVEVK